MGLTSVLKVFEISTDVKQIRTLIEENIEIRAKQNIETQELNLRSDTTMPISLRGKLTFETVYICKLCYNDFY